jgi:hypothetical protein
MNRSYGDSLRQQAKWIREALDPATPRHQRIALEDIDVDEIEAAAAEGDMAYDEIAKLRAQVEYAVFCFKEIQKATIEGKVCDDVAWFSQIETLHDYCGSAVDRLTLPSTELPHGVVGEAKEGPSNAAPYGNSEREIRKRDLKARTDAISPQESK